MRGGAEIRMKKTLIIAGMIVAPLSVALARGITFDTKIQWNTNVIAQALKDTGFKPRSSVGFVYDRDRKSVV